MMEFLRALAPSHATAKTRAVPVVPSRFAAGRLLTRLPAVHVETLTPSQGPTADRREMVRDGRERARVSGSAREDDAGQATPAERDVVTASDRRVKTSPVPEPLSMRSTPQPLHARAVPAPLETATRAERVRGVPRPVELPARLRATQVVNPPLQTTAVPLDVTVPEAAGSAPDRGPLSAVAVAARAESRAETRPIIHVTIDRIEVRAPSAPERPSSRPRVRSSTSASLSEYLRSRQSSRGGGPS